MSEALIQIKDLSVAFPLGNSSREVVHDFSLEIPAGKTLSLVGESGSGKTVTASSILRLIPGNRILYPTGEIIFNGQDLLKMPERELLSLRGGDIAMIFQEPLTSLNPLHTVEKQISENILLHSTSSKSQAGKRALELIERVGIREPVKRMKAYPHELSGGERQRVMIAMALANNPKLLIADEPTTALDVTIQAQILDLVRDLQEEFGMAILFITHDLSVVRRISDRVCVMKDGRKVEEGTTEQIFESPKAEYTQHLIQLEHGSLSPELSEEKPSVLEVKDLKVWFPVKTGIFRRVSSHIKAVDGVTLTVPGGESLGIVGESGSGKTTLGRAILRLVGNNGGEISYLSQNLLSLKHSDLRPLRKEIQIIFQDPFGSLNPRMTIQEIVQEGLEIHSLAPPEEWEMLVVEALEEVGLQGEMRSRYPHEFSGGQRQRIALARALILKPKLLVLDEPTSSLDRSIQFQVVDLLKALQEKHGLTYLFISHDLAIVRALCHRIAIMKEGKIVEQGSSRDIFQEPQHPYTQKLLQTAFVK